MITYTPVIIRTYSVSTTFRITSKNCDPDLNGAYWVAAPICPYNDSGVDATFYTGSSNLSVSFQSNIQADGTGTTESENILTATQGFEILQCSNPVAPPFVQAMDPLLPNNASEYSDAGNLVSPFFYKDTRNQGAAGQRTFLDERTFFVQPSLTETVTSEWQGWAIPPAKIAPHWRDPSLVKEIPVAAQIPLNKVSPNPPDPVYSLFPLQSRSDWVTNPAVTVAYGAGAVAATGGIPSQARVDVSSKSLGAAGVATTAAASSAPLLAISSQGITARQIQAIQTAPLAATTALARFNRG